MANITVHRNRGQVAPVMAAEWDPFRIMREMVRWDPYREIAPVFAPETGGFYPAFDIKETAEGFVFRADLPGIKAEDLNVTVEGTRLQVSGKREAEHEERSDTFYASERSFGTFVRTFTLPYGADVKTVRADLKEGILTIWIAKTAEVQPRRVAVQSGTGTPRS